MNNTRVEFRNWARTFVHCDVIKDVYESRSQSTSSQLRTEFPLEHRWLGRSHETTEWSAGSALEDIKIEDSNGRMRATVVKEHEILTGRSRDVFRWPCTAGSFPWFVRSCRSAGAIASSAPSHPSKRWLSFYYAAGRVINFDERWAGRDKRESHSYLFG